MITATIYDLNANHITQGLQPSSVCDEAILTAKRIARRRDEDVILEEGDSLWVVSPDGSVSETTAKEIGFE